MGDKEKIERVKQIVTRWALDDSASCIDALIKVMEALDFDPYDKKPKVKKASGK